MDGVERVMVLGILAVIAAILSFAWSATDDSTTPDGHLDPIGVTGGANGGRGGIVPLSSNSTSGGVVLDDSALNQLDKSRLNAVEARRQQKLQRDKFLKGGSEKTGTEPKTAPKTGAGADQATRAAQKGVTPSTFVSLKPTAAQNEEYEAGSDEPTFRLYTLADGDTLWGLAFREVGAGNTDRVVALIQELNPGLSADNFPEGRTIRLPLFRKGAAPVKGAARLQNKTPSERAEETGASVYVVGAGDTLEAIARNELGDRGRWKEIYQLNKTTVQDPESIRPGQRLLLPEE